MTRSIASPLLCLSILVLLGCRAAEAQRLTSSSPVTFYAAPNGIDLGNDCLSQATPCTPQGAHSVALRKWDFAGSSCTISLAPGVYNTTVDIAGQYVGAHLCQVYGYVDSANTCIDRTAVVLIPSAGRAAFDIEDEMMASIACITVQGGAQATGFFGRQHVVIDLADINCGSIGSCITLTAHADVNIARDIWISGNEDSFVAADRHSRLTFADGSNVVAKLPVNVGYLFLSYNHSMIEFAAGVYDPVLNPDGNQIINPQFLAGSRCEPSWMGTINANGVALPCTIKLGPDGKVY